MTTDILPPLSTGRAPLRVRSTAREPLDERLPRRAEVIGTVYEHRLDLADAE